DLVGCHIQTTLDSNVLATTVCPDRVGTGTNVARNVIVERTLRSTLAAHVTNLREACQVDIVSVIGIAAVLIAHNKEVDTEVSAAWQIDPSVMGVIPQIENILRTDVDCVLVAGTAAVVAVTKIDQLDAREPGIRADAIVGEGHTRAGDLNP